MDFAWVWSLIGAGVGAYSGGYLRTKGENLATHEDIEKLNDQVKVVTRTTEEIKAEISDAAWNRQKRWELKREALFGALGMLSELDQVLFDLNRAVQIPQRAKADWHQRADEKFELVLRKVGDFEKAMELVAVTCDVESFGAFSEFNKTAIRMAREIVKNHNPDTYTEYTDEIVTRLSDVRDAVRLELRIDSAH